MCGRAGSKGIKNKNMSTFLGEKLALYSLSAIDLFLKKQPDINYKIALNTDSKDLQDIIKNSEMRDVIMVDREESLAGDVVAKMDVIKDTLIKVEEMSDEHFDYILDLDLTAPLRTVADISRIIDLGKETNCDIVISVAKSRRNPYFNMLERNADGRGYDKVKKSDFTARQQAPDVYDINGSLYLYKNDFLKNAKTLFDGYMEVLEMKDTSVLDLDEPEDFIFMEIIGEKLFSIYPEFKEIKDNIK